jgi:hypothetical protein
MIDEGFLKTASDQLRTASKEHDFVSIASVIDKWQGWIASNWRAIFDSEFRKNKAEASRVYLKLKHPLKELIKHFNALENSFETGDVDSSIKLARVTPAIIDQVSLLLAEMNQGLKKVDQSVPSITVTDLGLTVTDEAVSNVQQGYKQNKELLAQLAKQLPERLQKEFSEKNIIVGGDCGKIPIANIHWFQQFNTENMPIPTKTEIEAGNRINKLLKRTTFTNGFKIPENEVDQIVSEGLHDFMYKVVRPNILKYGVLIAYKFPPVSQTVKNRNVNEMYAEVQLGALKFPCKKYNILLDVTFILNDLAARRDPTHKLIIAMTKNITLNTMSTGNVKTRKESVYEVPEEEITYLDKTKPPPPPSAQKPEVEEEEDEDLEEVTATEGILTRLVKRAIINESLPMSRILVSISEAPLHYRLKFAKVLTSALRGELDADVCSIHNESNNVEVECDLRGSVSACHEAVEIISKATADAFEDATSIKISVGFKKNASSIYKLAEPDVLEESFRKVAMEVWHANTR